MFSLTLIKWCDIQLIVRTSCSSFMKFFIYSSFLTWIANSFFIPLKWDIHSYIGNWRAFSIYTLPIENTVLGSFHLYYPIQHSSLARSFMNILFSLTCLSHKQPWDLRVIPQKTDFFKWSNFNFNVSW
jgi:hypothetical protein